jgi:lipopolysaccharide/colanic/teichoic acid biosynthesis glycosyltransferase
MKRIFDLMVSAAALIVLIPLAFVIAVAIVIDSRGPILFKQQRVGLNGRIFAILKFRNMRQTNSYGVPQITVGKDIRITRVGAVLRQWKLDELPQLWNVVLGEMSLVGPRPEVPKYVALYPDATRQIVLSVRPGITDPCSISLRNESALLATQDDPERFYIETLLPRKLQISSEYVISISFFSDLRIIMSTITAVIFNASYPKPLDDLNDRPRC